LKEREFVKPIAEVCKEPAITLKAKDSVGRISADFRYDSPPGYPFLLYGERITPGLVDFLGSDAPLRVVA